MKKIFLILTTTGFAFIGLLSACSSPSQKVESAQQDLTDAKQELNQAQKDSIADYESFKKESEQKISENEKAIAAFRIRMVYDKKSIRESDQKMIDQLEERNIEMRRKIEAYKVDGKNEWTSFRSEFNHDMDELGQAIKAFSVDNKR